MKIRIIKEKKVGLLISTIICFICCIFPFFTKLEFIDKIIIFIMLLIAYLIILLCFLISMEWYIIDIESVTVKNVFGTVNKVYYKDIKYCYVKRLPVFTRDIKGVPFLLLNDGKKENSFFYGHNVDNHKKYIVRIPYTQEVVDYFKKNNIELNNNSIFKTIINE